MVKEKLLMGRSKDRKGPLMKVSKLIISWVLILVMTLGLFGIRSFANVQIQVDSVSVDNVYYVVGENASTGESMISPTMTMSWKNPSEWAPAADAANQHSPDFYEIDVENVTSGLDSTITVNDGSDEFNNQQVDIHEFTNLDTGSLYKIVVNPYHYHEDSEGNISLATVSGLPKYAYAITDLDVNFESNEDSITVIWDNVGISEFEYRIVYALGDYSGQNKQAIIDNKEGEITGLTVDSDDVTSFYDPVTKRHKLSYTLDQNIYPGQVYSVFVEPTVEYYEGVAVTRNINYPLINNVSTNIELSYTEDGDYLRLQWAIPASFVVGSDSDQYELTETRIMYYRDGQGQTQAILNAEAGTVGYYTIEKPIVETGYQLELTYEAVDDESKPIITPVSNYLTYSPTLVEVVPTKPYIPDFISQEILDDLRDSNTTEEVRDILAETYLVPGSTYLDSLDDLFSADITYHLDTGDNAINLVWSAFRRIDIDQTSDTYNEYITDLNTYYDIWVTNSYDSLSYASRLYADQRYSSTDSSFLITSQSGEIVGFSTTVDGYYNYETGDMETIRPNQIYYIKIQAKKIVGDQEITSEPSITTLYYTDDGATYVPPLITKPPLHVKEDQSTPTSLTLAWNEQWWEVIDPAAPEGDALNQWLHEVWVQDDGTITSEAVEGAKYFPVYESQDMADSLQTYLDDLGLGINLEIRNIDLGADPFGVSNIHYKFLKIKYEDVDKAIRTQEAVDPEYSFLEYFDDLVTGDKDGTSPLNWTDIETEVNPDNIDEIMYTSSDLLPNTSYLFVLYPYRVIYDDIELTAHYPTPIIVATEPEAVEVNPDPTVPSMYVTDKTDRTITLSWQYNTDFEYEIVYSSDDTTDKTVSVDIVLPDNVNDPAYPKNGQYYEAKAVDLFPDTGYYFFIRAKQTVTGTSSTWSNPVFGQTLDVDTPAPPIGIGVPSDSTINAYGYDASVTNDHIAISWLKDVEDTDTLNQDSNVIVSYSYIIEMSNNDAFIGPLYVVSGDSDSVTPAGSTILDKNLVLFDNLVSNRYYYFRMKTRVRVEGTQADQLIVKESDYYSPVIRILTVASDTEYDSSSDPAVEILPGDNYELSYDSDAFELVYRFRDNSMDADGNADNNVDQRLISDLIKQNIYQYTIDVANYNNKPVSNRVIEIPYSIVEAFDSYNVDLMINAGDMELEIPHDGLINEVNRQKNQYGVSPTVKINISNLEGFSLDSRVPEKAVTSVSVPQDLNIKVTSSRANKSLDYTDVPIKVLLNTENRYSVYHKDPVVYASTANGWDQMGGSYNQTEGAYEFTTRNVGSFGVYIMEGSQEIQSAVSTHWSEPYKDTIDSLYTLKGLSGYNPDDSVNEDEYLNIIYNVTLANKEIDTEAYVNKDKLNALYYSGLKSDMTKGASSIKREEAISMMMAAMEIRDNLTLAANKTIESGVNSNPNISSDYKTMIAKAASYGLVSDLNQLRPQDNLTYGELFALWAKAEEM